MKRILMLGVAVLALSSVGCGKAAVRALGGAAKAAPKVAPKVAPKATHSTSSFGHFGGELGQKALEHGVTQFTKPTSKDKKK